jgi:LPS-assembly protein
VQLCYKQKGVCVDNPLALGYLSPTSKSSPIASRAVYHLNSSWSATGDYVYDVATHATNNSHLDFRYQPAPNHILSLGYTYFVNGDITQVAKTSPEINPLHQGVFSYAWPFNEKWSSLGAYSYNLSKRYSMMSVLGLQYDNCCWALRLLGGRSFMNLNSFGRASYNNNVYLQVQLKGLGSVGNSSPAAVIRSFVPGYVDSFHH